MDVDARDKLYMERRRSFPHAAELSKARTCASCYRIHVALPRTIRERRGVGRLLCLERQECTREATLPHSDDDIPTDSVIANVAAIACTDLSPNRTQVLFNSYSFWL